MTSLETWCLVVPVKRLALAKTRLAQAAGKHRSELALAFALDTVDAALRCPRVRAVVAVTDEDVAARALRMLGATVVADFPDAGLNPALVHGADTAREAHPGCGVGALSADVPALRPDELATALQLASGHDSSFVRDASHSGTTLLLARVGTELSPRFGPSSAERHADEGAFELLGSGFPSLRRDVDTEADLADAVRLGLGRRSADVVARLGVPRG